MKIKHKFLFFALLLLAGGCVETDLVPGSGEVRFDYDWTTLTDGTVVPSGTVAYVYPDAPGKVAAFYGENELKGGVRLARGAYRVLTFNQNVERINFTDLADFDLARASLRPLGTKAGENTLLPPADWLYGGVVTDLQVNGRDNLVRTIAMNPYIRRIHIEIQTDASKIETASGKLTNTAIGINLKDGKPAPTGNGTTQFELTKTERGLLADFVIFGVDSSAWTGDSELKNIMEISVVDAQNNRNELEVDISGEIAGGNGSGGKVEEEMTGIGLVRITVDGWEADDEDNSLTETPIRLTAYRGVPVKSAGNAFMGEYGVFVERDGTSASMLYTNNKVSVDAQGNSLCAEEMYYPTGLINVYAYAPYSENAPATWTLTGNMEQDDLLYVRMTGLSETPNAVALNFGHLMSALRVEVIRGTHISEIDFDKTEVYVRNTVTTAGLDLKTGSVTVDVSGVSELRPQLVPVTVENGMAVETCIIPQSVEAGKVLVYIKVAGREDLIYTYKSADELVFASGRRKVLRLTLNDVVTNALTKSVGQERVEVQIREENF